METSAVYGVSMIFKDERRRRGNVIVTPAIKMTAAASGSNGITVADDDDIDFGTGDFFLHWDGSLPDWTPSAQERLIRKYNGSTAGFVLSVDTNGTLIFFLVAGSGLLSYPSTVPTGLQNGGIAKVTLSIVRSSASTAGSVTFYVNGAPLGSPVAITAAASITASTATALAISGGDGTTGTQRTASNTISCIVGNFAPTAAEVLDLCTNGIPESWKWGSQTAVYTSDFSAGTSGFSVSSGCTIAGNIDGIGGVDDVLRQTSTASSNSIVKAGVFTASDFKKYTLALMVYRPSANVTATGIRIRDASSNSLGLDNNQIPADTWTLISAPLTWVTASTGIRIWMTNSSNALASTAGDIIYYKTFVVMRVGATMALLPNSIPTSGALEWPDSSGNTGGGTLPAAGATKVTIRR